jgi:O-antigen ligase
MLVSRSQASSLNSTTFLLVTICGVCAIFAFAMTQALSNSSIGAAAAIAIAVLPLLLIAMFRVPLQFPYAAYAVLVPFDLLLNVPALGTAARLCGALSGIALLFWLIRTRSFVRPGWALAAWGGYIGWVGLSLLWSLDPVNGMREFSSLLQLFLLYALASVVPPTPRDLKVVFAAVVVGGLIAGVFGIHELSHLSAAQVAINQVSDRIPLLVGNQKLDINEFADSLLPSMAILIVTMARAKNLLFKLGCLGGMAVLLYAMSLAASREAFVAVGVMFVYFAIVMRERWQLIGIVGVLGVIASANGNLLKRFSIIGSSDGSGRLDIWKAAAAAFREHWLAGAGAGSFATAYNSIYLKVFQQYDMGWSRAAHNMLLQNSVEYGVIGALLIAVAMVTTFLSLRVVDKRSPLYGARVAIGGALLGLCVAGFFVDLTTGKILWLTIAIVALVRSRALMSSSVRRANVPQPVLESRAA